MANKYIIHGAAFNGDGTSSALATSNGGVGAWNTLTYFEGVTPAYGAIAAGDTVFVRTKSAAGADITTTISAAGVYGTSAATAGGWVNWVFDGGAVWPGVSGVVTFTQSANYLKTFRPFNRISCDIPQSLDFKATAGSMTSAYLSFNNSILENCGFDWGGLYGSGARTRFGITAGSYVKLVNPKITAAGSPGYNYLADFGHYARLELVNPDINLASISTLNFFQMTGANSPQLAIFGGRLYGEGAVAGAFLSENTSPSAVFSCIGFQYPTSVSLCRGVMNYQNPTGNNVFGADGGSGSAAALAWGELDSRNDGRYPTLDAMLPDSAGTPWSWKMYPIAASITNPWSITSAKMYVAEPALHTITTNFIASDAMALNRSNVWVDGYYIDAVTGLSVGFTTQARTPTPLTASSAAWSAVTYGAVSLNKYEISFTTPTAIKKDTVVSIAFRGSVAAANQFDLMFFDPSIRIL